MDIKCDECGKNLDVIKRCSRCKKANYCSVECQRRNWAKHKTTCVETKTNSNTPSPNSVPSHTQNKGGEVKTTQETILNDILKNNSNIFNSNSKNSTENKPTISEDEEDGKQQQIPIYNEPLSKEDIEKRQKKAQVLMEFFEKLELSDSLVKEGNNEEAKPNIEKCLELLPECIMDEKKKEALHFSLLWNMGRVEEELGNLEEGLKCIGEAGVLAEKMERYINLTEISNDLGRIYIKQEKYEEAIKSFNKSLQYIDKITNQNFAQDKSKAIIHMNLGNCYLLMKEYDKATENYLLQKEICLKSAANEKGKHNLGAGQANYNLGKVYYETGKFEEARDSLLEWQSMCETINSLGKLESTILGEKQALSYLGKTYYHLKQYEKSIEMFEKLDKLSLEDKNFRIQAFLGIIKSQLKLSQTDNALKTLGQGLEIDENNFLLNYRKAKINFNILENKKEEAKELFKKLLETAKDKKKIEKINKYLSN